MSKKTRTKSVNQYDRHHICFQRRYWDRGYARAIRNAFVRYVPVVYHRELHAILNNIPVPPADLLREAWVKYMSNADEIDSYNAARAAAWLYANIPDVEFRKAMQRQIDYLAPRIN